jgi:hypothetical protein
MSLKYCDNSQLRFIYEIYCVEKIRLLDFICLVFEKIR